MLQLQHARNSGRPSGVSADVFQSIVRLLMTVERAPPDFTPAVTSRGLRVAPTVDGRRCRLLTPRRLPALLNIL